MTNYQSFGRKRLSIDQKNLILQDHFEKGVSISELARKNQIHPITLYNWKKKMADTKDKDELDIHEILAENEKLKKENSSLKKPWVPSLMKKKLLKTLMNSLKKNTGKSS